MKKSIIRITAFLCILTLALLLACKILKFKYSYSIQDIDNFYSLEDDTVDVLFIGTSHAYANINTGTLWDDYGMASCVLAGSEQAVWNTYYYLAEALKTQKPKLVVFEAFGCTLDYDYGSDARVIQNTYGLKWSKNKVDAIIASVPEDKRVDFLLSYARYHSRYAELTAEDFAWDINDAIEDEFMGYQLLGNVAETVFSENINISTTSDINAKAEQYLRMIIGLCQDNEIPMAIIVSPYAGVEIAEQEKYNQVAEIAAEYGIPYENFTDDVKAMGIDFSTDEADYSHFNYLGSPKYSTYLGSWLTNNFDIPNRAGTPGYERWEENSAAIKAYQSQFANQEEQL